MGRSFSKIVSEDISVKRYLTTDWVYKLGFREVEDLKDRYGHRPVILL